MSTPWEGSLEVRLGAVTDDNELVDAEGWTVARTFDGDRAHISHALVHRANAYEEMRAALQRIADEDLDQGDTMGLGEEVMLADAVAIARRTLDSLEDPS